MRSLQYLPWLESGNLTITVRPLLSDEMLQSRYKNGGYGVSLLRAYADRVLVLLKRRQFDIVWIEKEALPWLPLWLERILLRGVPYVLDYDDAIFHLYDQHANSLIRRAFGQRLDGLMKKAALVIGGNHYLTQRAVDAGAEKVEMIPTVIDLLRYPLNSAVLGQHMVKTHLPRIVWIGSPSTVRYLEIICEPLRALAMRQPFVLRVIGGGAVNLPGIQVETINWTEATEVAEISACQVGVMPLLDSMWERGKCGYKLVQYMACGLPVVASDVGVNSEIVMDGDNGFLASSSAEWLEALSKLLKSSTLRAQMGAAGRRKIENSYCLQKTGPRLAGLLNSVVKGR